MVGAGTADKPITLFISLFLVFFILAIFTPFLNSMFGISTTTSSLNLKSDGNGTPVSFTAIIGNLFLIPFVTLGLPSWLNLFILLPIRIIMDICIYKIFIEPFIPSWF